MLVFTRTKLAASRLASRLDREGLDAVAIHSDRSQPERTRALEGFKNGEIRVLVATDVAARGLDIEDLPVVVNFELPWNPQDYIHRIGRTGRAGATGEAISLVCIDEVDLLRGVQRMLKQAIPWTVEEGFVPDRNVGGSAAVDAGGRARPHARAPCASQAGPPLRRRRERPAPLSVSRPSRPAERPAGELGRRGLRLVGGGLGGHRRPSRRRAGAGSGLGEPVHRGAREEEAEHEVGGHASTP